MSRPWYKRCPECGRQVCTLSRSAAALRARGYVLVVEHRLGCTVYRSATYPRLEHKIRGIVHLREMVRQLQGAAP